MADHKAKSLDENYEGLKAMIRACDADYEKFKTKKVKVSANRVRANMLNCKKMCDVIRSQLLEQLRQCPTKQRGARALPEPEQTVPEPEPEQPNV